MVEHWGKYRLEHLMARGGMAEIFKARNVGPSGFEKPVCIKRIRVEYSNDSQFVEMFQSEARIAATLHHPNIVQVFDFDHHEKQLFLTMELVEGLDLRQILEAASDLELRVPVRFAVHVTEGLLRALVHAHGKIVQGEARPVIHRDVSPHNILVSNEGVVKLVDFGIAKVQGLPSMTRTGVIKGKLAYLSPEQARGQEAGPGTDIFGVGLVLWEMLAGERLIKGGDDKECLANLLTLSVPPVKGVCGELNSFVRGLLEPDQKKRFPSAATALEALGKTGVPACTSKDAGELVTGLLGLMEPLAEEIPAEPPEGRRSMTKKGYTKTAPGAVEAGRVDLPDHRENPPAPSENLPIRSGNPPARTGKPASEPVGPQGGIVRSRGKAVSVIAVATAFFAGCLSIYAVLNALEKTDDPLQDRGVVRAGLEAVEPGALGAGSALGSGKPESIALSPPVVHLTAPGDAGADRDDLEDAGASDIKGERRSARSPAGTGFIEINVRPWARVKVDGQDKGFTPVKGLKARAGSHRVVLINDELGYKKSFKIQVRPGKTSVLNKVISSPKGRESR